MIPMLMKIRLPREDNRSMTLYLPLFIAWLLLAVCMIILAPIALFVALVTWRQGFGKLILMFFPSLVEIIWHMHGLLIDVDGPDGTIYMSFI